MAKVYWIGGAASVAQVWTASIDSVDGTPANNTFTVTIGGVAIDQAGDTDVATTAAALVALLDASTHPYFSSVTWTNPSAGNIVGTADVAGMPFDAALTETGAGTGSVTDFAVTTANASAYSWDTAANWSGGAVPVNSDEVYVDKENAQIYWGLVQSGVTVAALHIRRNAKIGLDSEALATNTAATTENTAYPEHRQDYLAIKATTVKIGENLGPSSVNGTQRMKIDNSITTDSTTEVFNTASSPEETNKAAVRLLFSSANADLFVRSASAGVAIADDHPGETSTVGNVVVSDTSGVSKLFLSDGVTASAVEVKGGVSKIQLAATLAAITMHGGVLSVEGDQVVTLFTMNSGKATISNVPSGGVCVTTLTQNGGEVDLSTSKVPRTVTNYNYYGGTRRGGDHLTITNDNRSGEYTENLV